MIVAKVDKQLGSTVQVYSCGATGMTLKLNRCQFVLLRDLYLVNWPTKSYELSKVGGSNETVSATRNV